MSEVLGCAFKPVNVVALLKGHFEFDVASPLDLEQIEAIERALVGQKVEIPPVAHRNEETRTTGASSDENGRLPS